MWSLGLWGLRWWDNSCEAFGVNRDSSGWAQRCTGCRASGEIITAGSIPSIYSPSLLVPGQPLIRSLLILTYCGGAWVRILAFTVERLKIKIAGAGFEPATSGL